MKQYNVKNTEFENKRLYRWAFGLAVFTILYNILEGLISTYFGYEDESLTLFGFGSDSFIEVISGFGILQMVSRIRNNPDSSKNNFEKTALHITGFCFYILAIGLMLSSVLNFYQGHKPETTSLGIIISVISIVVMIWLYTLGAIGLAWFSFREGKEAFEKAKGKERTCRNVCEKTDYCQ